MKKIYSSFDEIDKDLKILKLQKDIDLEEVKISYHEVKNSLSPIGLISNVAGAIAQKAFVLKANSGIGFSGRTSKPIWQCKIGFSVNCIFIKIFQRTLKNSPLQ